jgi:hypothetical protein
MVGRITAASVFVGITAVIVFVFTTGATAAPTSVFWTRALDSRPEAIATGAALLVLASVLRRSLPSGRHEVKE